MPASDVKRLLVEGPAARGLLVADMPRGSPGMEQGGSRQEYAVLLLARDGSVSVFSRRGS